MRDNDLVFKEYRGDPEVAQRYLGFARVLLGRMQSYLGEADGAKTWRFDNGLVIRTLTAGGIKKVTIDVSKVVEAECEEIELQLLHGFRYVPSIPLPDADGSYNFVGIPTKSTVDGKRYASYSDRSLKLSTAPPKSAKSLKLAQVDTCGNYGPWYPEIPHFGETNWYSPSLGVEGFLYWKGPRNRYFLYDPTLTPGSFQAGMLAAQRLYLGGDVYYAGFLLARLQSSAERILGAAIQVSGDQRFLVIAVHTGIGLCNFEFRKAELPKKIDLKLLRRYKDTGLDLTWSTLGAVAFTDIPTGVFYPTLPNSFRTNLLSPVLFNPYGTRAVFTLRGEVPPGAGFTPMFGGYTTCTYEVDISAGAPTVSVVQAPERTLYNAITNTYIEGDNLSCATVFYEVYDVVNEVLIPPPPDYGRIEIVSIGESLTLHIGVKSGFDLTKIDDPAYLSNNLVGAPAETEETVACCVDYNALGNPTVATIKVETKNALLDEHFLIARTGVTAVGGIKYSDDLDDLERSCDSPAPPTESPSAFTYRGPGDPYEWTKTVGDYDEPIPISPGTYYSTLPTERTASVSPAIVKYTLLMDGCPDTVLSAQIERSAHASWTGDFDVGWVSPAFSRSGVPSYIRSTINGLDLRFGALSLTQIVADSITEERRRSFVMLKGQTALDATAVIGSSPKFYENGYNDINIPSVGPLTLSVSAPIAITPWDMTLAAVVEPAYPGSSVLYRYLAGNFDLPAEFGIYRPGAFLSSVFSF